MKNIVIESMKRVGPHGKEVIIGLCAGRHDIPVEGYIYDRIEDPVDFDSMRETAAKFISEVLDLGVREYREWEIFEPEYRVRIYVTGLTAALCEVLSLAKKWSVGVTLMHFDRETGKYVEQDLW